MRGLQALWYTGLAAPRHVGSPGPGLKSVFPALAGGFLTTVPPGKSYATNFLMVGFPAHGDYVGIEWSSDVQSEGISKKSLRNFPYWPELSHNHSQNNNGFNNLGLGFPGGAVVENLPANAGDTGSSPGLGRSHMPRSN